MVMSPEGFAKEFPEEGPHIEFKSGIGGDPLRNTVVAFSNADGGIVLVGVSDSGQVAGREPDAGTIDAIHDAIRTIRDPGRYEIHHLVVGNKSVLVISVAARREGFSQTPSGVIRVRRGTMDEPLFGSELRRFINERSFVRYEETPTKVSVDSLDPSDLGGFAETFGWAEDEVVTQLEEKGYASGDKLTVAGLLCLSTDPAEALGKAFIEVLRFPEDSGIDYDQRVEIRGPVHVQVERTVHRIMDQLGSEMVVLGMRRYDLPRIPEIVLREALVNAVAHRSYELDRTPIRVEMRPSSVRILSPGPLPEPVTLQNLRSASAPRNMAVISLLRRIGLAEDAGRGIDVIEDTMREEMLDPPEFNAGADEVDVVLPVRGTAAPIERAWIRELEERGTLGALERLLLVHAARGEVLTNASAREIGQVDSVEARDALQRLRDIALLDQTGERGGTSYVLSGSLKPPAGLVLGQEALEDLIVDLASDRAISNGDVRDATGLERSDALRILRRLVADGRLVQVGERRGVRYRLPETVEG